MGMESIMLAIKNVAMVGSAVFVIGMMGSTLIVFLVCCIRRWSHRTAESVQGTPSAVSHKSH
jgi:hypothetical protein